MELPSILAWRAACSALVSLPMHGVAREKHPFAPLLGLLLATRLLGRTQARRLGAAVGGALRVHQEAGVRALRRSLDDTGADPLCGILDAQRRDVRKKLNDAGVTASLSFSGCAHMGGGRMAVPSSRYTWKAFASLLGEGRMGRHVDAY